MQGNPASIRSERLGDDITDPSSTDVILRSDASSVPLRLSVSLSLFCSFSPLASFDPVLDQLKQVSSYRVAQPPASNRSVRRFMFEF